MKVEYKSNNSGGSWWLEDKDWHALEKGGWSVAWVKDNEFYQQPENAGMLRWLGALATEAEKGFETPGDAMRDFESITGQKVSDDGCNCCGAPHAFSWPKGYASGERCLEYLYEDKAEKPATLREAYDMIRGQR